MEGPLFRIYYNGGKTYVGDPWAAPMFEVLVIVERCPEHGRRNVSGNDYYVWLSEENRWRSVDFIGLIGHLQQPYPRKVLVGMMVDNDVWNAVYKQANEDPDFPARSAYGVYEAKP